MKSAFRLMICALLALTCVPAMSQETGTLIKHKAAQANGRSDPNTARQFTEQFAACVLSRNPGRTTKIIGMRADTPEYRSYLTSLYDFVDECNGDADVEFSPVLFRGNLFQAFYAKEFKTSGPMTFDPALDSGYAKLYGETPSAEAIQSIALERFGECVARADATNVRALLRAPTGLGAESAAFAALAPRFSGCLTAGQKFTFSKAMIKGVLAEGLYRLSVAATRGAHAG